MDRDKSSGSRGSFIEHTIAFFEKSPCGFGTADIFCCGSFGQNRSAGDVAAVICLMRDSAGRFPFPHLVIVLPTTSKNSAKQDEASLRRSIAEEIGRLRGNKVTTEEAKVLQLMLQVVSCPALEVSAAVTLIQTAEPNSVLIFQEAARYRALGIESLPYAPTRPSSLPEDLWVPHLCAFAASSVDASKKTQCYVLLDAGEPSPYRPENVELLTAVDGTGYLGTRVTGDPWEVLAAKMDEWVVEFNAGHIGSVFSSIEALPESLSDQKRLLKIQLLGQAGLHVQTLQMIRDELKGTDVIDPEVRVKLGQFAEAAGDASLAAELLAPAIPLLASQEWLELALSISSDIGDASLEGKCLQLLDASFPQSSRVHGHRLIKLMNDRKYGDVKAMLVNQIPGIPSDFAEFYSTIASRLGGTTLPDYSGVIGEIADHWPSQLAYGRLICAKDALARGSLQEALVLSLPSQAKNSVARRSAWLLIRTIEQLFLSHTKDGGSDFELDQLLEPILELVRYLALNPSDAQSRGSLSKLLSVQTSGLVGLPLIAVLTLELSQRPVSVSNNKYVPASESAIDLKAFFEGALQWMERESPIVIGRSVLPTELLTAPADDLMSELDGLIRKAGHRLIGDEDVTFFEKLLFVGISLAPHTQNRGADLDLLRFGGGRLAQAGRVQRARDLAEQAVQIAGEEKHRSRLAWFAFADIYQRLSNSDEALLAMACALACEAEITLEQALNENYLLLRILRDLHLFSIAKSLCSIGRALISDPAIKASNEHRFVSTELGIRLVELSGNFSAKPLEIQAFAHDVSAHCAIVLERDNEIAPAAILLAQSISMCEAVNLPVEPEASQTLERMWVKLGEPAASMIRTVTTRNPSAVDVLALASRFEVARYADDTGFDVRYAVMAARHLLGSTEAMEDPKVAAFSIELLTDQAIDKPSGINPSQHDSTGILASIEAPAKFAQEFSRLGLNVTLIGLTELGRLVRVTADNGILGHVVEEEQAVFSRARLEVWARNFPYDYRLASDTDNLFYTSMRGLELTIAPSKRLLLVMDTALQQIPPNLLLVSGDFVGRKVAMAAVPSLAWLNSVHGTPRQSTGRRVSWMSTMAKAGKDSTLKMLADLLSPFLAAHAIELETSASVPVNLSGSEIVIIAAHGGVFPEGRFFQTLTDEADLRITPSTLSRAVQNVGVVILFVCSAGRVDQHPRANTTLGLAKQLLDHGCRTVIAPPWPIASSVPYHWLPVFLDGWMSGDSVIDANFDANKAVEKAIGDSPAHCLAMSVFGDPLTVKDE